MSEARCFRCNIPGERVFDSGEHQLVRCPSCGIRFVSPHRGEADLKAFYDEDSYFEPVYRENRFARWLRRTWETARLKLADTWLTDGARMLEVGCGHGTFLAHARDRGWSVEGVELSRSGAAAARRSTGLEVHAGTLASGGFGSSSFRVICAFDVIEHVPDPSELLDEIHRLLEPGGGLILSCPNVETWPARIFKGRWWTLRPEEHLWHFDPGTLRRAILEAGFEPKGEITAPTHPSNLLRFDSMVAVARKPV